VSGRTDGVAGEGARGPVMRRRLHCATVWLIVTASAGAAAAQAADAPGGDETASAAVDAARRHMEVGQGLYDQGNFPAAAQEFLTANGLHASSAFLFNVALCYLQAGDGRQAALYFRQYLVAEPSAPDRAAVEERLREIDASVAAAPPPPPAGTPPPTIIVTHETAAESRQQMKSLISVQTVPEGAHVVVEDSAGQVAAEGTAPISRALSAGRYVLRIEHPDFQTERTEFQVRAGVVFSFYYRLGQGEFMGFLRVVASEPGAQVFVDRFEEGAARPTPWEGVVPVGEHRVRVTKPGFEPAEQTVTVEMGRAADVTVELQRVEFGELVVLTNVDGAAVAIDGRPADLVRPGREFGEGIFGMLVTLPSGPHVVTVTAEDMKNYEEEVVVGAGQRTRFLIRLNPSPSRVSAWVSFSVAGACFIAGGIFGGQALDLQDGLQADMDAGRLDNNDPRVLEGTLWAIGADSAFLVGAVMTGLGFYYLFRDPLPDSEGREEEPADFSTIDGWTPAPDAPATSPVEVTPTTGPTGLGLGLEVRF